MNDVQEQSSHNYCEADSVPQKTFIEKFDLYFKLFFDIIKCTVLVIPLYAKWFLNLFLVSRKCIKNRVILITGGGNGLGRYLALELGKENCKIAVADIDFLAAKRTAEDLKELYHIESFAYHTNVGNYNSILKLHADIKRDLGGVDILINNAALLIHDISLREKEWTDLEPGFNVNFKSHFWVNND